MSMSLLLVHVHAACPCPYCIFPSVLEAHVDAAWLCRCCMSMLTVHVPVHAACPSLCCKCMWCCMSMSMLHDLIDAACPDRCKVFLSVLRPCPCYKYISMFYVHVDDACPYPWSCSCSNAPWLCCLLHVYNALPCCVPMLYEHVARTCT